MKAVIFDLQRASYVDGPGIRTTVFFKGCNLKCKWCHNPESQSKNKQILFYKSKCLSCGKCQKVCPNSLSKCHFCGKCAIFCPGDAKELCGREVLIDELLAEILLDKAFYDSSNGGVTFSGGECMLQIDFLEQILKACKNNGIHTAVDTAGGVPWEYFERILPYTDLFLYDVKCFSSDLHKEGTGVDNKVILDNLERLCSTFTGEVTVRIPLICGYNTAIEEITRIAEFLHKIGVKSVETLPYHSMGEHKWEAVGKELNHYPPLEKERKMEIDALINKTMLK